SLGVVAGAFPPPSKPENIQRPRSIEELAPGYQRVHREARERLGNLQPSDLDRQIKFLKDSTLTAGSLLWHVLLLHSVHHRGQLSILVRLAHGVVPSIFGPTREQSPPKTERNT